MNQNDHPVLAPSTRINIDWTNGKVAIQDANGRPFAQCSLESELDCEAVCDILREMKETGAAWKVFSARREWLRRKNPQLLQTEERPNE